MKLAQDSSSFGRYLQAIRLEKKISLEKVSAQTRIGRANLLMIEQEDVEGLPAEVFVKGFLRSFAGAIGADGDEAVRRYETRLNVAQKIAVSEDFIGKSAPRLWWKLLLSVVLLGGIIGISIFAVAFFSSHPDKDISNERKTPSEQSQPADSQKPGEADAGSKAARAGADKLRLKVTAVESTWLKIIVDETESSEHTLTTGEKLELEAASGFNLLIGNAAGLQITLDDKPVTLQGGSGQVVTINLP
jgi:transcriptional regulator with XRE-family HTH domain